MKIAVLGAGNGALATAADLALDGFSIRLFEFPEYGANISSFKDSKQINITGDANNGTAKLENVTTSLHEAVENADLILPVVPSYAHEKMAKELANVLKPGQIVVLSPGSTFGSLIYSRVFADSALGEDGALLGEIHTLPYACRRKAGQAEVDVFLKTKKLYFSAFPAKNTQKILTVFKKVFPNAVAFSSVLETGLNNGNPVTHVAPCVLNAGRIEYAKGEYYHYQEGITPSVAKVIETLDNERLQICQALGYREMTTRERILDLGYSDKENVGLYELYTTSPSFKAKGPESLNSRYLTEDTPFGLVPWYLLAKQIGLELPIMRSLIVLASELLGSPYLETGLTMEKLRLNNKTVEEIKRIMESGFEE